MVSETGLFNVNSYGHPFVPFSHGYLGFDGLRELICDDLAAGQKAGGLGECIDARWDCMGCRTWMRRIRLSIRHAP